MPARRAAFTMIEMLIAISVIAVLAGLLIPAITVVKSAALAANCRSNLKQVFVAHQAYAMENKGVIPYSSYTKLPSLTQIPWFVTLATYLDREEMTNAGGGYSSRTHVSAVVQCAALKSRYGDLMAENNPGYGILRNNRLDPTKTDYANSGLPSQIRWSMVTHLSRRLLAGDGWQNGTGTTEPAYFKGTYAASVDALGYYYRHQWAVNSIGQPTAIEGMPALGGPDPAHLRTDAHRGRRSYLMCDGSVRGLKDDYTNPSNELWLSISAPETL